MLAVVIFAGGLFGYDQGVISGALPGIKSAFSLSLFMTQVVTSWVTLGALVGSLIAGALGDGLGRKRTLLFAGGLFALGAIAQWAAPGAAVACGGDASSSEQPWAWPPVAAPLYAAELAPRVFAAGSSPAISLRSPSASSWPIWSTAHCRPRATGG